MSGISRLVIEFENGDRLELEGEVAEFAMKRMVNGCRPKEGYDVRELVSDYWTSTRWIDAVKE